jgi:hypothetical protein
LCTYYHDATKVLSANDQPQQKGSSSEEKIRNANGGELFALA